MEPIVTAVSLLAALTALAGTVHSCRQLRNARTAELRFRELLVNNPDLRRRIQEELTKKNVGDRTLEDLETSVSYLLMQLPKDQQFPLRAAIKQSSRRGQRDYLLKLAADETGH